MGWYAYTKRWRKRNPEKRKVHRKKYYDQSRENGNGKAKKHWTEEELRLMLKLSSQCTDQELSQRFGRSVQSIQSARCRWRKRLG